MRGSGSATSFSVPRCCRSGRSFRGRCAAPRRRARFDVARSAGRELGFDHRGERHADESSRRLPAVLTRRDAHIDRSRWAAAPHAKPATSAANAATRCHLHALKLTQNTSSLSGRGYVRGLRSPYKPDRLAYNRRNDERHARPRARTMPPRSGRRRMIKLTANSVSGAMLIAARRPRHRQALLQTRRRRKARACRRRASGRSAVAEAAAQ